MKVIKRNGKGVDYDRDKIRIAIGKANETVIEEERVTSRQIENIIKYIEGLNKKRMLVEDIQDIIEEKLMSLNKFSLAKNYIIYRYKEFYFLRKLRRHMKKESFIFMMQIILCSL